MLGRSVPNGLHCREPPVFCLVRIFIHIKWPKSLLSEKGISRWLVGRFFIFKITKASLAIEETSFPTWDKLMICKRRTLSLTHSGLTALVWVGKTGGSVVSMRVTGRRPGPASGQPASRVFSDTIVQLVKWRETYSLWWSWTGRREWCSGGETRPAPGSAEPPWLSPTPSLPARIPFKIFGFSTRLQKLKFWWLVNI